LGFLGKKLIPAPNKMVESEIKSDSASEELSNERS
jgi:hypothetical protein